MKLPLPVKVTAASVAFLIPLKRSTIARRHLPVAAAVTVEHGAYVAAMCIGCHGAGLSGGKIPGGPPDWPAAANITPGDKSGMLAYKDAAAFASMIKTGIVADGSTIKVMPFESLRELNGN